MFRFRSWTRTLPLPSFHLRTYVFDLRPTRAQKRVLDRLLESTRLLYNAALQERRDEWDHAKRLAALFGADRPDKTALLALDPARLDERRRTARDTLLARRSPSFVSQETSLTLKAQEELLGEVVLDLAAQVRRWPLRRVDKAFQAFFDRVAEGKKPGYPRFKAMGRWSTFGQDEMNGTRFVQPEALAKGRRGLGGLRMAGVPGELAVRMHRLLPDGADVRSFTLTRDRLTGTWRVGLAARIPAQVGAETDAMLRDVTRGQVMGVDVGVLALAATDCGLLIPPAMPARKAAASVRRQQRKVARARHGSHRRRKTVACLARARRKERHVRRTASRLAARMVVSRALERNCRAVAVEDLNLRNMTRSARGSVEKPGRNVRQKAGLNRSMQDAAPGLFVSHLRERAGSAGLRVVEVDPRRTSVECSSCGSDVPKTLRERVHRCGCGLVVDRDVNAAGNHAARGAEVLRQARPLGRAGARGRSGRAAGRKPRAEGVVALRDGPGVTEVPSKGLVPVGERRHARKGARFRTETLPSAPHGASRASSWSGSTTRS